jgi:hypothetical protein
MQDAKKLDTSNLPTLESDPRWQELGAQRVKLAKQCEEYRMQCNESNAAAITPSQQTLSQLKDQLTQWAASDVSETFEPSVESSIGTPAERAEAARLALEEHDRKMALLRHDFMGELSRPWEIERRKPRRRIVELTLELKKAFDEEATVANQMHAAGVLDGLVLVGRPFVNFSGAAQLPGVIRRMNAAQFRACNADLLSD